ncbi:MAG: tRNA lysidine(34) synthetase TilS [Gemmataceae bacterium]
MSRVVNGVDLTKPICLLHADFMHVLASKVVQWLTDREGRVLVALSGGPDSVALLRALVVLGRDVVAAHLNHLLRGDESDGDETFVRELCAAYQVPLHVRRLDVAARASQEHDNLEQAARRLRYDWLAEVAADARAAAVATGHTADDQAETVLHRMIRGTGLKGLRGIAPERELTPGIALIRPMLEVTRAEILDFLKELEQPFRLDRTNLDPQRTRNRIRHGLLPLLTTQFNPEIVTVLCRLAEQAEEAFRDIEEQAALLLTGCELPRAGKCLVFERRQLAAEPAHRVREMFRLVWTREGWPLRDMHAEHWERLAELVQGMRTALDLPGGVTARLQERVIQLMVSGQR